MDNKINISDDIFSILKGNGLKIKLFDKTGNETTNPSDGVRFFVLKPNIMVTIDDEENTVTLSKGGDVKSLADNLQKNIKKVAEKALMNFSLKVFGRTIEPKDYAYQAKMYKEQAMNESTNSQLRGQILHFMRKTGGGITATDLTRKLNGAYEQDVVNELINLKNSGDITVSDMDQVSGKPTYMLAVDETSMMETRVHPTVKSIIEGLGKMYGSLKTSNQVLENVKIIVKHKLPVDESISGARTRQISKIFLECNGQRVQFPYPHLNGARAMAQHISHGGILEDTLGSYIIEKTSQLYQLKAFNKYVSNNNLINESTADIISVIKENMEMIKTEFKKIIGSRTYETVKSRVESMGEQTLNEDEIAPLKELFTVKKFDEQFQTLMPVIGEMVSTRQRLYKALEEAVSNTVFISSMPVSESAPIAFRNDAAKVGFKLSELSTRIINNESLSNFVSNVSSKITKGAKINTFEQQILSKMLENLAVAKQGPAESSELLESVSLAQYFDKFDNLFV